MVTLFPRLSRIGTRSLLAVEGFAKRSLQERLEAASPYLSYATSGGSRINKATLTSIRQCVLEIAGGCGFPDSSEQISRSRFDSKCGAWLADQADLTGGEALRDEVWGFLATCLVPEVTIWRFGWVAERFFGGTRNTFQRLWMRGKCFDRGQAHEGRWELLDSLSEDAMVQIMERTSVAANVRLTRAIGEIWLSVARDIGTNQMERVTREAVRSIRIANEVLLIATLDDERMTELVEIHFRRVSQNLGRPT